MKKYEYVSVHIGKLLGAKTKEHKQIIAEYAQKGYRYVGYIPTVISDFGKIKDIHVFFIVAMVLIKVAISAPSE